LMTFCEKHQKLGEGYQQQREQWERMDRHVWWLTKQTKTNASSSFNWTAYNNVVRAVGTSRQTDIVSWST
jgi:hypothetical protein